MNFRFSRCHLEYILNAAFYNISDKIHQMQPEATYRHSSLTYHTLIFTFFSRYSTSVIFTVVQPQTHFDLVQLESHIKYTLRWLRFTYTFTIVQDGTPETPTFSNAVCRWLVLSTDIAILRYCFESSRTRLRWQFLLNTAKEWGVR